MNAPSSPVTVTNGMTITATQIATTKTATLGTDRAKALAVLQEQSLARSLLIVDQERADIAAIIFVIIPICFLVSAKVLSVTAGVLLGIFGSFGFIVLIYPVMLCWMVMAYHVAMPGELPANGGRAGRED